MWNRPDFIEQTCLKRTRICILAIACRLGGRQKKNSARTKARIDIAEVGRL